ncbi:flagellar hook-associated protein FlgL [Rhodoferax sp.]|uniref:flagellar hook-associated protein FlgL n=1 Tax=Rhodoferax sp. TaxID=50421 RepID=UPI00274886CB|nr:flagellar hook-associated protein FlgL [Rhodoferax sp.]
MRLGTANTYDSTLSNLMKRQVELSGQQEKLTSGKKINRASDDPTGAALAERALTRTTRIETEERALVLQRNAITLAESALGDATALMQSLRELVVKANNGAMNSTNRASLAQEMRGLRDQLFASANRNDTNGIPLFGGLGSAATPFSDPATGVIFNGIAGQRASTEVSLPGAMDGSAIFMNVPTGNGTFNVALGGANTGTVWAAPGQVVSPGALTGDNYTVTFTVSATVPPVTTYDVVNTTTALPVPPAAQPYVDGQTIAFDGLSFVSHGVPQSGDTVLIAPSTQSNIFEVLDRAIASIDGANGNNIMTQATNLALVEFDAAMDRIQSARGQAGDWLNRGDRISSSQTNRSIQLQGDRSKAEDLDMVQGISDFQKMQTGYQAALQSYASVQRLSLFNFIN